MRFNDDNNKEADSFFRFGASERASERSSLASSCADVTLGGPRARGN